MGKRDSARPRELALSVLLLLLSLLALVAWFILIARGQNGRSGVDWLSIAGFGLSLAFAIASFMVKGRSPSEAPARGPEAAPAKPSASTAAGAGPGFQVQPSPLADELTGLPARIWFTESLATELYRSTRYVHPLSMILLDVDQFSRIVRTHGEATGDYLLMAIAKLLRSSVRQSDLIGRIGEDSFAVLAPETNLAGALKVGEKLRRAVELYPFDEELEATVSVSVVSAGKGADARTLLERAEETVAAVARKGGNSVAESSSPASPE